MGTGPRKGFLAKLLGRWRTGSFGPTVRRHEKLNFVVPAAHADEVRASVEAWLAGRGVQVSLTSEDASEGRTRLHAELDDADAQKVNFADERVQAELEDVLSRKMR